MHKKILTENQVKLLPLMSKFKKDFYLVGGTAIALQIGHRESIDFDLFSQKEFKNINIRQRIERKRKFAKILVNRTGELTFYFKNYLH
jgi:hypothetical protein